VCVYLVLQLIIGIIIENIEMLEKIENMKISQKHLQVYLWARFMLSFGGLEARFGVCHADEPF
jgi:hypothetical protein